MLVKYLTAFAVLASVSEAMGCPNGQHNECILPRPWGGCAQSICVPNIDNPVVAMTRALESKARDLAQAALSEETARDREDCVAIVTAGIATWGTTLGGPWIGLISGGAGAAAASLACRNIFPSEG